MDYIAIEKKWQDKWQRDDVYKFDKTKVGKKKYVMEMFSYPSGAKLHAGHWFNFGPSDSYARFKAMQGYNVFEPMGFDAFGLPAENYAIKTGIHPEDSTLKNIDTMERQLKAMGAMFNWDAEVVTCMPDYYKWTQWMFVQLYKAGLAYRKEAPVNWCPSCATVLANEQVVDGACERCNSTVVRKNLTQWFFKITDYAEELLNCLDDLDWPEKTKLMQKNWIGKSTGAEVEFTLDNGKTFRVFTTRADTLYGVSYVVLAPEHPLVDEITTPDRQADIDAYRDMVSKVNEIERLSSTREKTGAFTGAYAINPINGKKVQVWVADYVLYSYGTGAVMGVPSHDERDFAFANKYGMDITRVVKGGEGVDDTLPFVEEGYAINCDEFDGLPTSEAKKGIVEKLASIGKGKFVTNYRLRDWLVSRQRYWGAPIPVVYCDKCGTVVVPEEQLPVLLPRDVDFKPDGKSPLRKHEGFMNTTCPHCGGPATREADTLDTFVCSSWYFLRYPDNKNQDKPFDSEWINQMLPVDKYIGGAEHACMHLLYARFFVKALRDMGYLNFDEPFKSLVHQGIILGPDGQKMSKSRGNVVSPDSYIDKYGADAFRMYLMFGFSYTTGGPWSDDGIRSIAKYLDRVERLVLGYIDKTESSDDIGEEEKNLNYILNTTIKKVTEDMEAFSFNTAIARLMELTNAIYLYKGTNVNFIKDVLDKMVRLLAPITPHFSEELNMLMGKPYPIIKREYPLVDESALVKNEVEIAIQINSKIKGRIMIPTDKSGKDLEEYIIALPEVVALIGGATVRKIIVVPGRLANIIVG
ncbi:MAG: leucine--tRNA ligase [Clostridia bacterium]|nr:leucine--tRNA ligase [Clostridia bacterium]